MLVPNVPWEMMIFYHTDCTKRHKRASFVPFSLVGKLRKQLSDLRGVGGRNVVLFCKPAQRSASEECRSLTVSALSNHYIVPIVLAWRPQHMHTWRDREMDRYA